MSGGQGTASPRWLLVSDIDDTLTGDDAALAQLVDVLNRHRDRIGIALNSSRPSASVDRTIAEVFPADFAPAAIITAMGTEIRIGGIWDEDWRARFAHWPRDRVAKLVAGMGYAPHAAEYQTPSKASFKVPGGADLDRVTSALSAAVLDCRVIHSGADDLDLLPPGADKGAATLFLAEKLGIRRDNLLASGDSGNDLAMLEVAGVGIAVGNARRELLAAMPRGRCFQAKGRHAAGVLEGLIYWGALPGEP